MRYLVSFKESHTVIAHKVDSAIGRHELCGIQKTARGARLHVPQRSGLLLLSFCSLCRKHLTLNSEALSGLLRARLLVVADASGSFSHAAQYTRKRCGEKSAIVPTLRKRRGARYGTMLVVLTILTWTDSSRPSSLQAERV